TIVHHIKILSISNRRRYIRSIREGPKHVRTRDVAATTSLEREQRPNACRRVDYVVEDDWRRDNSIRRVVIRIEPVAAPELLACGWIVTGDAIATCDHDLSRLAVTKQSWRRV